MILIIFFLLHAVSGNEPQRQETNETITIQNLGPGINTEFDEYFPILTINSDVLFFTKKSFRNEDLYLSHRDSEDGSWRTSKSFFPFNSPTVKEGAASMSLDGKTIYLTLCNERGNFGKCDLYACDRVDDTTWTRLRNLGDKVNFPGGWQSQPCIAPDNRTLYFASNRPGGYGKIDIWKTHLEEDGSWSSPQNLGASVNGPGDEQTPFIHMDNQTLYFSADLRSRPNEAIKGIYVSRRQDDGQWSEVVELSAPINSSEDNFGITVTQDGRKAFFSSYRPGGFGNADLYSCDLPEAYRPNKVIAYQGQAVNNKTQRAVTEGWVKIVDLENKELVYNAKLNRFDGSFLASLKPEHSYIVNILGKGHVFYSKRIHLTGKNQTEVISAVESLEKLYPGARAILYNVLFDVDKAILKPESYPELDNVVAFIKSNPGMKISVYGYTDNTFTAEHNQKLSEQRAKVIYYYLLKGLMSNKQLVSFKGFGATEPLATNETAEGRQKNRRAEIIIESY